MDMELEGAGPPRVKRLRHSHRHTQSLGLLSPIPSRDSLRSNLDGSPSPLRNTTTPNRSQIPSRVGTPSGKKSTPGTPRSKRTSLPAVSVPLPALLATFFHSTSTPEQGQEDIQPVVPVVSPDRPRTPSRSEQLLRDTLRRGSMSSPSRPASRQSQSYFAQTTPEKAYYGGDAEFTSNSSPGYTHARALTLSQLEGTGQRPAVCERDPAHEALRARLERMLSSPSTASSSTSGSSRRTSTQSGSSTGDKRASTQSAVSSASAGSSGRERGGAEEIEAQREWNALIRANAEREDREQAWKAGVNVDSTPDVLPRIITLNLSEDRRMTPRPRTPAQVKPPRTPTRSRDGQVEQERERTPRRRRTADTVGEDMNTVARANHDSPNNQSPYTPHRVNTPTPGSPYSPSRAVALPNSPYTPSRSRNNSNVDLARRNTSPAVPASPIRNTFVANTSPRGASPQRNTFASSPQRSTFAPAVRSSPALGGSPTVRARAQTEPAPGSPTNPMSLLLQSDQERDVQRRRGHSRKSSAYAALAALNAAAGPSAHPAYPGLGHGHPNANAGYIHARPQLETLYQETSTPGSTPPLTGDVRDESASEEDGESEDAEDTNNGEKPRRVRNGKLLTPPATPPRHSLVVASANVDLANDLPHAHTDLSEYTHHTHDEFCSRPTFNARKASAQCRQLEGYVSFAAVEGLGEPPSPGPSLGEDDEEELPERRRKRGSLGAGIVGLWRGTFW